MDTVVILQKSQEIQLGVVTLTTCTYSCRYKECLKK